MLEGLTFELRMNLDLLRPAGSPSTCCTRSVAEPAGGSWLQLKADITGIPVVTPRVTEAAALGAALLAGVGAGLFPSAAEAAGRFLQLTETYTRSLPGTPSTLASTSCTDRSTPRSRRSATSSDGSRRSRRSTQDRAMRRRTGTTTLTAPPRPARRQAGGDDRRDVPWSPAAGLAAVSFQ